MKTGSRHIIGIQMGTNYAPLIADLFLYYHEKCFMDKLVKNKQLDLIQCFNRTSRYLDDILNLDNPDFEKHISEIYPKELNLTEANHSDTHASLLDLDITIDNSLVHTKIYDKRDDFGFPIVNFPWLDGDVPRAPCYGIYISQLVRFARASSNINDFDSRNLHLTSKLLSQGYRYHRLRKTFGKFYKNYKELLLKYGSLTYFDFISEGISHPTFYGDFVFKIRKILYTDNFYASCVKIIKRLVHRRYDKHILRQTLCMILGPYTASSLHNRLHSTLTGIIGGTQ